MYALVLNNCRIAESVCGRFLFYGSFSKSLRAATGRLLEKPNMGKALAINMVVKNLFQG